MNKLLFTQKKTGCKDDKLEANNKSTTTKLKNNLIYTEFKDPDKNISYSYENMIQNYHFIMKYNSYFTFILISPSSCFILYLYYLSYFIKNIDNFRVHQMLKNYIL